MGKICLGFLSVVSLRIIQWTSQTNVASPDVQSLCKKDEDALVYMCEGGNIYTSSTTKGTHGRNNEWAKNDDRVNEDKWKTREKTLGAEMEGGIEVWSRKMQTE